MAPIASVATVHEAEERLRADRANANEIIDLLDLSETGAPRVRLAAVQSCRAVFTEWAASRALVLASVNEDDGEAASEDAKHYEVGLIGFFFRNVYLLDKTPHRRTS